MAEGKTTLRINETEHYINWIDSNFFRNKIWFINFVPKYLNFATISTNLYPDRGFGYPGWGFTVLFPQLQGKCEGINRKDVARPALFPIRR
jgi:hypothetical protein